MDPKYPIKAVGHTWKFTWGKYEDVMIIDVPANYLLWMDRECKGLRQDVKMYIEENRAFLIKEANDTDTEI